MYYGFRISAHPTKLTSGDPCCRESPKHACMCVAARDLVWRGEQLWRPCAGLREALLLVVSIWSPEAKAVFMSKLLETRVR
jgi:hypothetical protein